MTDSCERKTEMKHKLNSIINKPSL